MQQLTPLILLVVLLVVFWLVVLRPARNQQRTQAALQSSLEVGDEVVLSAGMFGTIRELDDARVHLEIAPGTVVQVARQVVVRRVDDSGAAEGVDAPTQTVASSPTDGPAVEPTTDEPAPVEAPVTRAPAKKTAAKKTTAKKAAAKRTATGSRTAAAAPAEQSATETDGPGTDPGPGADGDHEAVTLDKSTDEAQDADRG